MRSLIVDDVEMNRELLALFLEGTGDVVFAETGEEALERFAETLATDSSFDLICMDISMPGMDGHETLKKIREMEVNHGLPRAIAFMVTGSSCPNDMYNALVEGDCDDYLTKPLMQKAFSELLIKHGLLD